MTLQGFGVTFNGDLNLTLAVIALIVGLGGGHAWGIWRSRQNAITDVQHALDRAARDLRLYRDNVYGTVPSSPPAKALHEAEYIVRWRSAVENMTTSPQGISRLNPPDVPRTRSARLAAERANRRNIITALGRNQRPDDTYVRPIQDQMSRRYTRPAWEPKGSVDAPLA